MSHTTSELAGLIGDWATRKGPLYRKLSEALSLLIREGVLRTGDRLPSERDLAKSLAVSRATVVAAYDELRGSGLIESLRGSGTRVIAKVRPRSSAADGRVPGGRATSIFQRMVDGPSELISLAFAGEPAADEVGDALAELVRHGLPELMSDSGYHPRGYPPLLEAISEHLTQHRLPTVPDQVLVTTGAQQAIGLIAQMYLRPGATVVVESPSWPGCLDVFRASGAKLIGVPLDDEGVRTDGIAQAFAESPVLAYLMPTYHNPTGTLMSADRRRQLAELAARFDVPVVEDNAYSAFATTDGQPHPPPIAAFAGPGAEVLTVGSLAKAVWGGLRIGWIRGPGEVIERLARHKVRADLASPVLDQAIAVSLLPKIVDIAGDRACRLRPRLDHLKQLLTEQLPQWRWQVPDGGSALWIELPDTDAQVFAQVALRHGVEIVPGSATDPSGAHDGFIRLPYTFPVQVLTETVARLRRAWLELRRHGPTSDPVQTIF
ncbi:MAG TPA: PLP-dependent aminotransferase family protein [Actinokineospora sp.]|nr:PLP-dependent aminotransferase family protein [Actinokineospora sp.]